MRVCRGGGRDPLPRPELPTPPGGAPHQNCLDPRAGLTSCFSAGPWPWGGGREPQAPDCGGQGLQTQEDFGLPPAPASS